MAIGVLAAFVLLGGSAVSLRVNFTESLPIGLYRTREGPIVRDAIVLACLPAEVARFARARGYLWRGDCPGDATPVGKLVLATGGDVVRVSPFGLEVNGRLIPHTQPFRVDRRGLPVRHYPFGLYTVMRNELWLYSARHPLSYDSRYFGPVRIANVRTSLLPLWTVASCCQETRMSTPAAPDSSGKLAARSVINSHFPPADTNR